MNVRDGTKPPVWTSEGPEYRHPMALKGYGFPPERALNWPQERELPRPTSRHSVVMIFMFYSVVLQ